MEARAKQNSKNDNNYSPSFSFLSSPFDFFFLPVMLLHCPLGFEPSDLSKWYTRFFAYSNIL